ncbi:hypothetical protein CDL12_17581 [Handroanthus impetiginosus]|uniref:ZF-HD dimerization-type domain-containing protein n=1 Tax=Handroanthus impetiginosus TaxID=429701 RepID=A0A2G9GX21_9LAMI|nr:hypothetical protein CDL12_17581 [Handroanthus impetiginosus]
MNYVVDGCGLFEASDPNGTLEAMVCAACHCHRNFHRTVIVELSPRFNTQGTNMSIPAPLAQPQTSATHIHQQTHSTSSRVHGPAIQINLRPQAAQNRTRMKITREQTERLRSYAERNNWKMFREYSKEEVDHICSEIGIAKKMLKNWINNHRRRRMANNATHN